MTLRELISRIYGITDDETLDTLEAESRFRSLEVRA
jgi:hypothetical protein